MSEIPKFIALPRRVGRLGDRVVATILDHIALIPLGVLSIYFVAWRVGADFSESVELHGGPALASMGIMALSWMTYYILGEWLFGGTLGKHMMGIQVRSGTEAPATISQIIVRNVARFVDVIGLYLLGFAVAACSKRNQRSGDHLAGTVVFEAKTDRGFALFLWICWLLVISIGTVLVQRAATS